MPIDGTDIRFMYSNSAATGGSADSGDPTTVGNVSDRSLGKFISTGEWTGGTANDLFDDVSGDENAFRAVDYRCIFVHNGDPTRTLFDAVAWILSQQVGGTDCAIGVDPTPASLVGDTDPQAVLIPIPFSAPPGVEFAAAASKPGGVLLGNIVAGGCRAIWVRRSANDSPALDIDGLTIRVEGDSEE